MRRLIRLLLTAGGRSISTACNPKIMPAARMPTLVKVGVKVGVKAGFISSADGEGAVK